MTEAFAIEQQGRAHSDTKVRDSQSDQGTGSENRRNHAALVIADWLRANPAGRTEDLMLI